MPLPRCADDVVELGVFRLPTEFGFDFCRAGDQHGGVAGATRELLDGYRMSGYSPSRLHDLPHGKTLAVSQVVDHPVALIERLKGQKMRLRQILHVNVIADPGAVRCGIVLTESFDAVTPSDSHIKNERNQVRFGLMGF